MTTASRIPFPPLEKEFVVWDDGQVYFRVVGDEERVWAGPDAESFRRIASA